MQVQFLGWEDALVLKLQYFGHLMRRVGSLEKTDAGRDWGQEEKETTEDETKLFFTSNTHTEKCTEVYDSKLSQTEHTYINNTQYKKKKKTTMSRTPRSPTVTLLVTTPAQRPITSPEPSIFCSIESDISSCKFFLCGSSS